MKLRALQILFVGLFLCFAGLIVHQGQPRLLPPPQAQFAPAIHFPMDHYVPAKQMDSQAAEAVIRAQLIALRRGDFAAAVQYQSQSLQQSLGSTEAFRHMMLENYPEFLHFHSIRFSPPGSPDFGIHVAVPVMLQTDSGRPLQALYLLVREGRDYKVQGVMGGMPMAVPMPPPIPPSSEKLG